jgi:hypothetical protein
MSLSHIFQSMMGLSKSKSTDKEPLNFRGIPTAACPNCGGSWFNIPVSFDPETYDIDAWGLEAECFGCGTLITAVCPVDAVERDLL